MPAIFISYRREDSAGYAGRMHEELASRLGSDQVFRDADTLRAGQDFEDAIRQRLNDCQTCLVLIGPNWVKSQTATGERRTVSAGDVLLLPFADAHKFWQGDFVDMAFGPDLMRPGLVKGLWTVDHGGGGKATRMVCGFIESAEFLFAPIFRSLPPLVVDRTSDDKVAAVITSTVREILGLADAAAPGTELMLGRLMELYSAGGDQQKAREMARRYLDRAPKGPYGRLARSLLE